MSSNNKLTDFGARQVPVDTKTQLVGEVFRTVADQYDWMNDLMSLGSHRLMKRLLLDMSAVRSDSKVLDLAGGTADMSLLFADRVKADGELVLADINSDMLRAGRDKLLDKGITRVHLVQADAEHLPMPDATFDVVVTAFGLRNFTDKEQAMRSVHRCLKPGGRFLILEFSKPSLPLVKGLLNGYMSFWPLLGKLVTGHSEPYRYLVESIERHPDQATLSLMLSDAGFESVRHHDLMLGAAALHLGVKSVPA